MTPRVRMPLRARWLSWRVMRAKRRAIELEDLWWDRFGTRLRAAVDADHVRENVA